MKSNDNPPTKRAARSVQTEPADAKSELPARRPGRPKAAAPAPAELETKSPSRRKTATPAPVELETKSSPRRKTSTPAPVELETKSPSRRKTAMPAPVELEAEIPSRRKTTAASAPALVKPKSPSRRKTATPAPVELEAKISPRRKTTAASASAPTPSKPRQTRRKADAAIAKPAPKRGRWLAGLWQSRPRFTRRWAMIMLAGLCLYAAMLGGGVLLFLKMQAPAVPQPPAALSGALPIDAVKSARVGDSVTVTVGAAAAVNGQPATLTMLNSYGPRMYRSTFTGGTARFLIPGDDTQQSGAATLIATAGTARGEAALTLMPDTPVEPITPLVGARSITADTKHWSMSVVVPFDRFGNPVAEGTPVNMRVLHPGGQLELQSTEIHNMIGWARIFSLTRAGRTTVSVTSAGKYGPDATFTEVPGWPIPFALSASPANVPADGRQLVTLHTDVIRDTYGNAMLDGTLVTFVVDMPVGQPRLIPAYTIDGVAKAQLQAPTEPSQLTVRAEVYDAESRPLQVSFAAGPAVNTFPVTANIDAVGQAIDLQAGPMLGALQQFIPDGTLVEFWLTDATGQRTRIEAISKGGYAQALVRLAALPLGTYTAEVNAGSGHGKVTFKVPYETPQGV